MTLPGRPPEGSRISSPLAISGSDSFTPWAGIAAILSAPVAIASLVLLLQPIEYDPEAFRDPARLLALAPDGVESVRWGLLLDLLGYYLLLAPLAIVTRRLVPLRHEDWGRIASWSAGAYILVGALGAAGLAAVYPALADIYSSGGLSERTAAQTAFTAVSAMVVDGLWNTLEVLLASVWFLVVGLALRRRHRAVGILSLALGGATMLDATGNFLGAEDVAAAGLNLYLFGAPLWAMAVGVMLLRRWLVSSSRAGATPEVGALVGHT